MVWHRVAGPPLRFRRWPDEWLVFNPSSGSTHLLTPQAGMLLEFIDTTASVSREMLIQEFADGDELAALDPTLQSFMSLGLIRGSSAP